MKQRMMSLFVALAFGGAALHAMDAVEQQAAPEESTVKRLIGNTLATGEVITEKTLPALAEKYSPISKEDDEKVKRWLENPDNLRLLMKLTQIPQERTYKSVTTDATETRKAFEASGIKNLSKWNYVWHVDQEDPNSPIIKVGGKNPSRLFLLVGTHQNPYDWIREHKQAEGKAALSTFPFEKTNDVTTHQTTSRMALWLRARERAREKFVIPAEHLVRIPGQGHEGHDENYITVEKPLKNAVSLSTLSDEERRVFWSKVSPATFTEAIEVISYAGLWCVKGDNLMVFKDDTGSVVPDLLAYADFEQPNNDNERYFFHQDTKKYVGNALCGIGEFQGQFADLTPDQVAVFRKCFKTVLDERYPGFKQAIIDAGREGDIKDLYE
jgi:hypothetical protein